MRTIVIGAKGMLGGALVEVFSKGGEVLAWDKEDVDITQFHNLELKVQKSNPDLIINAAAYNGVDGAESKPEIADKVNGYAVGNLAKVCKQLRVPLVHYSTEYVFDGQKKEGYQEDDEPKPISKYGQSKLLGERELQKNTNQFYLIRLSRLFGKGGSANSKKSFVDLMLSLAKKQKQIDVVDEELSAPTYAPDLARLTKDLVDSKREFGIYHGANSGSVTWYGFAREIFKIAGVSVRLNPVPASYFKRAAKRPQYGVLLNTKLPQTRPWQEALQEFLS